MDELTPERKLFALCCDECSDSINFVLESLFAIDIFQIDRLNGFLAQRHRFHSRANCAAKISISLSVSFVFVEKRGMPAGVKALLFH